jgi:hypothetical protein
MRIRAWINLIGAAGLLGLAGGVAAQQTDEKAPAKGASQVKAGQNAQNPDLPSFTPEREAAALTFAGMHHPELASLLEQLKSSNPKGYRSAVQELFAQSERLARLQTRTPERYETELALWKLDSRIRLKAARSAMSDATETREELKALLLERNDLRLSLMRQDRDRQAVRLEKLDASIQQMEQNREQAADNELERLLNTARNRVKNVRPRAAKEAVSPNAGESRSKNGNSPTGDSKQRSQ